MSTTVDRYLDAVRKYTSHVTVPGLSVISDPMPLQDVFVQLQIAAYTPVAGSPENTGSKDKTKPASGTPPTGAKPSFAPASRPEEASAVLTRCSRLVILGEPGQGKSTLLRHYASTLASETDGSWIPLFVELGKKRERMDHAGDQYAWLYERLPDQLDAAIDRNDWPAFAELIKSGRTRILLDGFDELTRDARLQVVALLEGSAGKPDRADVTPPCLRHCGAARFQRLSAGGFKSRTGAEIGLGDLRRRRAKVRLR